MSETMVIKKSVFNRLIVGLVFAAGLSVSFGFVVNADSNDVPEEQHQFALKSDLIKENSRGNIVNTWAVWLKVEGDRFHIHTINSPEITQERFGVISKVLFSDEKFSNGNVGYYGWNSVLSEISKLNTHFLIPSDIHPHVTEIGEGDIVIRLTNQDNEYGYTGFTKLIVDDENHQILKAEITIYGVDKLNDDDLELILRHELGHGLGLGHSDSRKDLMSPVIQRDEPYISECDIDALVELYNNSKTLEIRCDG